MITVQEQEKLSEIANRVQAATPGPWVVQYVDGVPWSIEPGATRMSVYCNCKDCTEDGYGPRSYGELVTCDSHVYGPPKQDAELIANAPSDLHFLLELVKRLANG